MCFVVETCDVGWQQAELEDRMNLKDWSPPISCWLLFVTFVSKLLKEKKRNGKNSVSGFIQFLPSTSMLSTQFSPGHFSKSRVKLRKISWSGPCFQKHVRFSYKKNSRKSLILSDALKEMEYLFTNFAWLLDFLFADTMKMQLLPTLWR